MSFVSEVDYEKIARLRKEAIREMISTERSYVEDLDVVKRVFLLPIRESGLLTKDEEMTLFSNIEQLRDVNQKILELFDAKIKESGTEDLDMVGEILLSMADYLKMYTFYCSNQPIAVAKLEEYTAKKPRFAQFLEQCLQLPVCRGLTLFSYLIKPIQRICKYPLLLREIIRHTLPQHMDYEILRTAMGKIEEVVDYVNEGKRRAESQQKILAYQNGIDNGAALELLSPTRRFIREELVPVVPSGGGKPQERMIVLFNDLFMVLRPKSRAGTYHSNPLVFDMRAVRVLHVEDSDAPFGVELQSPEGKALLALSNEESKRQWYSELRAINNEFKKQMLKKGAASGTGIGPDGAPLSPRGSAGSPARPVSVYGLSNKVPTTGAGGSPAVGARKDMRSTQMAPRARSAYGAQALMDSEEKLEVTGGAGDLTISNPQLVQKSRARRGGGGGKGPPPPNPALI